MSAMRSYTSKKRRRGKEGFELDGVTFTAAGDASLLDLSELAKMADFDTESPEGFAAMADFFRAVLGKAEYERLRTHLREHSTDHETLLSIMEGLVEDVGGRPTQRPSPSADGQTAIGRTSQVVSLSRGTVVDLPLSPEREAELRAAVERATG